ncbi:MAG TPA: L-serine ammonia-lyase, iron-sulfur-dependent, subunit beta [Clostridiales bacterium]|jgi:L-serine dehydratase|nr:L-serine ammonia-lyase, iron-sulfur-dependent, subunit beta [Clostridiales bacterium]HBE12733.1 L-serine ammonia-lyase, iron-sulfur-dependent, subunit beta [Clostridiales bacterium]HCG35124.1 L-serine ammonia-lyase, iron-sulfur-dependent, subunit beta [Clostridiales bacterium]
MNISIFESLGPVMIGPSSSHTAGAARLSRIAGIIAGKGYTSVSFGLHGSFAKTYLGHGTDKALVAGALGLREDDEHLALSFDLAKERKLSFSFYETELDDMHENSVQMTFLFPDGHSRTIIGASIGGGIITINRVDGFVAEFSVLSPTVLIFQKDIQGMVSRVSKIFADFDVNIANLKLSRDGRGGIACCIIETDGFISNEIYEKIKQIENILSVCIINEK